MIKPLFIYTHTPDMASKSYIVFDALSSSWAGSQCPGATHIGYRSTKILKNDGPWLMWGLMDPIMMRTFEIVGVDYYYSDMGYFYRKTPAMKLEDSYWRLTKNAFLNYRFQERLSDRWDRLGITIHDWQPQHKDKHIILCDVSSAHKEYFGIPNWLEETHEKLSQLTDRHIIIRGKPRQAERDAGSPELRELLANAHAVVTLGSQAAVEAVIAGVPCFVHKESHAHMLGSTNINDIEAPLYPDRRPGLYHIAYSQFTVEELRNGYAWEIVND